MAPQQWTHESPAANLYPINTNVQHLELGNNDLFCANEAAGKWSESNLNPTCESNNIHHYSQS